MLGWNAQRALSHRWREVVSVRAPDGLESRRGGRCADEGSAQGGNKSKSAQGASD
jgi:hypothetical protein